jgi:hypothetical protein
MAMGVLSQILIEESPPSLRESGLLKKLTPTPLFEEKRGVKTRELVI